MAARVPGLLEDNVRNTVLSSKILVVGSGGIGCELLKNLVLTGFEDIHVIDLDTIDVSNLNRQFLFRKKHVGKSKAVVAKESAEHLNPDCKITAYHDSITNLKYDVEFYKQFSAVTNALDNLAARTHVNRMCLAADIPLVESGSSGYLGQVTVYKRKVTECYECTPRPTPKDYPTCTIRNTPSETIHCVVWAKHLFNQLFGEEDPNQDVSPDPTDLGGGVRSESLPSESTNTRVPLREWAKNCQYDAISLFHKLFKDDVVYLLQMKHLWEYRRTPTPLDWSSLPDAVAGGSEDVHPTMKDQQLWSIQECANVFKESLDALRKEVESPSSGGVLTWDKDDKNCVQFVAACTNIRAHCFGITQESMFKIQSMAGNIIPAIATTNAIVGGLIVLQLMKVLKGSLEECRTVILNKDVSAIRKKLLTPILTVPPDKKCFVCSPNSPEVYANVNFDTMTVKTLREKILIERLNMIAPDVLHSDGKGTILVSSDLEEMDGIMDKTLASFNLMSGIRLNCDDFFQHFALILVLTNSSKLLDQEFEIVTDISELKPNSEMPENEKPSDSSQFGDNPDIPIDDHESSNKRKLTEDENGIISKRQRVEPEDDEICVE